MGVVTDTPPNLVVLSNLNTQSVWLHQYTPQQCHLTSTLIFERRRDGCGDWLPAQPDGAEQPEQRSPVTPTQHSYL
jgi:hypothetical protein